MNSFLVAGGAGFLLGISLIIAIGAQNALILRQGLLRSHVFVLCLICALSDALLITLGVLGFGTLLQQAEWLLVSATLGGAIFLVFYGALAFKRALKPDIMTTARKKTGNLKTVVITCLALTFLNPHVYLDTVILLGGLSAQYDGFDRLSYGIGASIGSFIWFFSLGYGARLLVPLFEKPAAWRMLDILITCVMWAIAASLLYQFFFKGVA